MKPRILVVDDEESIREFLEIMLKKEGFEILSEEKIPIGNGYIMDDYVMHQKFNRKQGRLMK